MRPEVAGKMTGRQKDWREERQGGGETGATAIRCRCAACQAKESRPGKTQDDFIPTAASKPVSNASPALSVMHLYNVTGQNKAVKSGPGDPPLQPQMEGSESVGDQAWHAPQSLRQTMSYSNFSWVWGRWRVGCQQRVLLSWAERDWPCCVRLEALAWLQRTPAHRTANELQIAALWCTCVRTMPWVSTRKSRAKKRRRRDETERREREASASCHAALYKAVCMCVGGWW
ncbi:hypothetical protein SRHO_G00303020 [Serrasalmus rhombeus]